MLSLDRVDLPPSFNGLYGPAVGQPRAERTVRRYRSEGLLTSLQSGGVLARRSFELHGKPERSDHEPRNTSRDVLRNLEPLFISQFANPDVVGLDFRLDLSA